MASASLMFIILALATAHGSAVSVSLKRELGTSLKERPIMKVVRLLQDMGKELQADLQDDKEVHEMLVCWCKSNREEKTASISAAKTEISQLEGSIGEATAKRAELKVQRKESQDEMFKDQNALNEAGALRIKENQEFASNEKDLLGAIQACQTAITVLEKHNTNFAQIKTVAHQLEQAQVADLMSRSNRQGRFGIPVLKDFLQTALVQTGESSSDSSFLAIAGPPSYSSQSGQIFGVLQQMKEDFESDLKDARDSEATNTQQYNSLKTAKTAQIKSAKKLLMDLDAQMADLGEKAAQETQQKQDVEDQLALDEEFMQNLEKKCSDTDDEFDQRVRDRLAEISAVEDTIKILNDEDAYDNFDATLNSASFLQVDAASSQAMQMKRDKAVNVLGGAVKKSHSVKLALLMMSARLDSFDKVREQIDKVIGEVKSQMSDETAKRDSCTEEMNANERDTSKADDEKTNVEAKVSELQHTIETLSSDMKATKAAMADSQKQMKRSSETREAENADFQQTTSDQHLTQMILKKALDRMKQVYGFVQEESSDKPGADHIETSGTRTEVGNGPARFKDNSAKKAGGSKIVNMLEEIIGDSKKMMVDAIVSEENTQTGYENFMKESNKGLAKMAQSLNDMSESRAKLQGELNAATEGLKMSKGTMENLHDTMIDLKKSCDFLMKNFDIRQDSMSDEINSLNEAKNILMGMK